MVNEKPKGCLYGLLTLAGALLTIVCWPLVTVLQILAAPLTAGVGVLVALAGTYAPLFRASRHYGSDDPARGRPVQGAQGLEHAHRAYPFGPARRDLAALRAASRQSRQPHVLPVRRLIRRYWFVRYGYWLWPTVLVLRLTALLAHPLAWLQLLVLSAVHLLVWAVSALLWVLGRALLWAVDGGWTRRRGRVDCVDPACGRTGVPVHPCPGCGREHPLLPGRYGLTGVVCACGHRLPVTGVLGVARLQLRCPHCRHPSPAGTGRARPALVHLFGPDAPGTARLPAEGAAALAALGTGEPGGARLLRRGDGPTLYEAELPAPLRRGRTVVLLDARGDGLLETTGLAAVTTLRRARGVGLLIDPDPARLPAAHTADRNPFARVLASAVGKRVRVAVIVPAAEGPGVGGPAAGAGDAQVRAHLVEAGFGNLVLAVEHSAGRVRYLAGAPAEGLAWLAGLDRPPRRPHRPRRAYRSPYRSGPWPTRVTRALLRAVQWAVAAVVAVIVCWALVLGGQAIGRTALWHGLADAVDGVGRTVPTAPVPTAPATPAPAAVPR